MKPRLPELLTIIAMGVGAVLYFGTLASRVDAQDREIAALKQSHKEAIEQVREDLSYIRERLDRALDTAR